ncbi:MULTISPECIES: hypothetical protein [unclassified Aureimonas]|uniref:hypothetical protein n=1 Tax=unclassified Aureimonas TaxID=2615206 RepID=UPI0006FD7A86|nr:MULTISPECIES: hypothetical protein [unclassified Aureimonas]KQT64096.1 hypothetical protein ASG62_03545 [Aureimonas sp. Leaf427]
MSNTPKTQPDPAAIDASISVLGEEGGEPKVASIDGGTGAESHGSVERAGSGRTSEGAQENLEAPITETEGAGHAPDGGSVERPGSDPDLV